MHAQAEVSQVLPSPDGQAQLRLHYKIQACDFAWPICNFELNVGIIYAHTTQTTSRNHFVEIFPYYTYSYILQFSYILIKMNLSYSTSCTATNVECVTMRVMLNY